MPINYSNGVIYKLCCNDATITDIYIGSTTSFRARKYEHNCCCTTPSNKEYNYLRYRTIRANGGWYNWSMIEIEKYEATDKHDLKKRERYWIETLKPSLNKQIPTRTRKEWAQTDKVKESRKNQKKQYRLTEHGKQTEKAYLKLQLATKIMCDICDISTSKNHIGRHNNTKKHLRNFILS